MQGKYRKIMVSMKIENDSWQFGEMEMAEPVCYVESYKEKRALFFHGGNLLPGGKYHLILIGSGIDGMAHQDFGPLHTGANGELQCYKTFGGPELEAYAYCLLCAETPEGQMDIVRKGSLFLQENSVWEKVFQEAKAVELFSGDNDETEAAWYRIEDFSHLPPAVERCFRWIRAYRHYMIGRNREHYYVGIPGRFLQKEQPLREEGVFLLWQPLRGGESYFERADLMTRRQQETIYGYWIAEVDREGVNLSAV